jgi:hypothetical protein
MRYAAVHYWCAEVHHVTLPMCSPSSQLPASGRVYDLLSPRRVVVTSMPWRRLPVLMCMQSRWLMLRDHSRDMSDAELCALQLTGRQRPGVSQFSQPHLLLKRGMTELSAMFGSDFEQTLLDAGGVSVNWIEECTAVSSFWHLSPANCTLQM